MDNVVMTNHSIQRTKERIGISKKIADKNAQKALEYGITHAECKAGLRRYMDKLYLSNGNANNVRIYHRYVYMFRDNRLIRAYDEYLEEVDLKGKNIEAVIGESYISYIGWTLDESDLTEKNLAQLKAEFAQIIKGTYNIDLKDDDISFEYGEISRG